MPTFNPQVTRYGAGLLQGMTEAGRAIGQGLQNKRSSSEALAKDERDFVQQKELLGLQQGNDVQSMAIGYGQKAALQAQEMNQRQALQDRSWKREDDQKKVSDTELVGLYEGEFADAAAVIPQSPEAWDKFRAGNLGTKRAMAEALVIEKKRRERQEDEKEQERQKSGTLEAVPIKDANGNIVGNQMVQQTPNGPRVHGWMPNQKTTAAKYDPTIPSGMEEDEISYTDANGVRRTFKKQKDGTVNILGQPANAAPTEQPTRKQTMNSFFGN